MSVRYLDLDTIEDHVAPIRSFAQFRMGMPVPAPQPNPVFSTIPHLVKYPAPVPLTPDSSAIKPAKKASATLRRRAGSDLILNAAPEQNKETAGDSKAAAHLAVALTLPNIHLASPTIIARAGNASAVPDNSNDAAKILGVQLKDRNSCLHRWGLGKFFRLVIGQLIDSSSPRKTACQDSVRKNIKVAILGIKRDLIPHQIAWARANRDLPPHQAARA